MFPFNPKPVHFAIKSILNLGANNSPPKEVVGIPSVEGVLFHFGWGFFFKGWIPTFHR